VDRQSGAAEDDEDDVGECVVRGGP
jgi:hypothetical protein